MPSSASLGGQRPQPRDGGVELVDLRLLLEQLRPLLVDQRAQREGIAHQPARHAVARGGFGFGLGLGLWLGLVCGLGLGFWFELGSGLGYGVLLHSQAPVARDAHEQRAADDARAVLGRAQLHAAHAAAQHVEDTGLVREVHLARLYIGGTPLGCLDNAGSATHGDGGSVAHSPAHTRVAAFHTRGAAASHTQGWLGLGLGLGLGLHDDAQHGGAWLGREAVHALRNA